MSDRWVDTCSTTGTIVDSPRAVSDRTAMIDNPPIERDAAERGVSPDTIRDVYERQSSMRTFVSPEEIADTVLFLASDKAGKISGQAMSVDGHTESLLGGQCYSQEYVCAG